MTEKSFFKAVGNKIWILLLVFLVVDVSQSVYHYSNLPIDGDLVALAAPNRWYQDVLNDPLGFKAIAGQREYSGAGRFTSHYILKGWFEHAYDFVGKLTARPEQIIFRTSSLFVFLLHGMFILLAVAYAGGKRSELNKYMMVALLASVFIQYNSYYDCIGIIDRSITYVFFYALPVFLLLLYFLPFFRYYNTPRRTGIPLRWHVLLLLLAIPLSFSGALIQPIVFICYSLFVLGNLKVVPFFKLSSNKALVLHFTFFFLVCAYAFYVSSFNNEKNISVGLIERYILLAKGLYRILTLTNVWLYLLLAIGINTSLIFWKGQESKEHLKRVLIFVAAFSVLYILLLPLGGYRSYRPYIIRYDTLLPVSLLFIYVLLVSTTYCYSLLKGNWRSVYMTGYLVFCMMLFIVDFGTEKEANYCQQGLIHEMSKRDEELILMPYICDFLMWDESFINDVEHMKALNKCLRKWRIIEEDQTLEFYIEDEDRRRPAVPICDV